MLESHKEEIRALKEQLSNSGAREFDEGDWVTANNPPNTHRIDINSMQSIKEAGYKKTTSSYIIPGVRVAACEKFRFGLEAIYGVNSKFSRRWLFSRSIHQWVKDSMRDKIEFKSLMLEKTKVQSGFLKSKIKDGSKALTASRQQHQP